VVTFSIPFIVVSEIAPIGVTPVGVADIGLIVPRLIGWLIPGVLAAIEAVICRETRNHGAHDSGY
jgi:hypothetical protein